MKAANTSTSITPQIKPNRLLTALRPVTHVEASDHGLRFDIAGQRHEYGPEFGPLKLVYVKSNAGNGALVVRANARP